MTAKAFLNDNPHPTEEEVKEALSGNFCRCISHYQVIGPSCRSWRRGGREWGSLQIHRQTDAARRDATDIVTGPCNTLDDLKFQNLLHGKVLRSPYAHA